MATYVMADIHGEIDRFHAMLDLINFSADDQLYIIGDVIADLLNAKRTNTGISLTK